VPLDPGPSARATLVVGDQDSATAWRSGSVDVLATPRLIALCEEACCGAVAGALPDGHTSVGVRVQFDHLAPVRLGSTVEAEATLEKVEGRRLTFTVSATDAAGLVGAGRMTRVVVEAGAFLSKSR
jgi:fluoroacetyl-CoA thioesterase